MDKKLYSMKEVCEKTGLTYDALKFYCNKELVPHVKRDENNRRVFSDDDIAWVESLSCLKRCGMTIAEMKKYVELCTEGEKTIPERKAILAKKRQSLRQKISELEASITYIDWKQNFYDNLLSSRAG